MTDPSKTPASLQRAERSNPERLKSALVFIATVLATRALFLLALPLTRSAAPDVALRFELWPAECVALLFIGGCLGLFVARFERRWVPLVGIAVATALAATGVLHADPQLQPEGPAALVAAALAIGLLAPLLASALRSLPLGGVVAIAPLLALLPPALRTSGPVAAYSEVVLDLLDLAGPFEVVSSPEGLAAFLGEICPPSATEGAGGTRAAIVIPPPGMVRLVLAPPEGSAVLSAKVGVDLSVLRFATRPGGPAHFEFTVELNGEQVARERVEVRTNPSDPGDSWVPLWENGGLPVRTGDVLTVETRVSLAGVEINPGVLLEAGIAELHLRRSTTRPRRLATSDAPNIVLVVIDTLRADRLSAYGYERPTSPVLEELAASGLLFEQAYSTSSWTWPSTASLLTGVPPQEHGVLSGARSVLSQDLLTLPEVLRSAGFATGGWSGNPLIASGRNFGQGFETFAPTETIVGTEAFFPEVLDWLAEHGQERFFLYLHLADPHAPWFLRDDLPAGLGGGEDQLAESNLVSPRSLVRTPRDWGKDMSQAERVELEAVVQEAYDASVWSADRWVGELREALEDAGLTGRTVLAVTSDHGEELFDHGTFGHGHSLYRELVHVPLVLAGPGVPVGVRVERPVSNRHLASSLAQLGGAALPGVRDPVDLLADFALELSPTILFSAERVLWSDDRSPAQGLRKGNWAFHALENSDPDSEPFQKARLFDLSRDPGQQVDVADQHPEVIRQFSEELRTLLSNMRPPPSAGPEKASVQEFLERLGYADQHEP